MQLSNLHESLAMIITNQQRSFLNSAAIDGFVLKTRRYVCENHPDHPLAKQTTLLDKKIKEVIQFAFAYSIKSEINILNLVTLFLDRPVGAKLSTAQHAILAHKKWNEDQRTEEFYLNTLLNS
jgi:hypothetical protein